MRPWWAMRDPVVTATASRAVTRSPRGLTVIRPTTRLALSYSRTSTARSRFQDSGCAQAKSKRALPSAPVRIVRRASCQADGDVTSSARPSSRCRRRRPWPVEPVPPRTKSNSPSRANSVSVLRSRRRGRPGSSGPSTSVSRPAPPKRWTRWVDGDCDAPPRPLRKSSLPCRRTSRSRLPRGSGGRCRRRSRSSRRRRPRRACRRRRCPDDGQVRSSLPGLAMSVSISERPSVSVVRPGPNVPPDWSKT